MPKVLDNKPHAGTEKLVHKSLLCVIGALGYALGMNLFVLPVDIYCGGMLGFCQIFSAVFRRATGLDIGFDPASLLYYAINIPLLISAALSINKGFLAKTVVAITAMTAAMTLVPLRGLIPEDRLTSCVLGGIVCGVSNGLVLRQGACGGGFDIVGMLMIKRRGDASVGKLSLIVNLSFFLLCGYFFDLKVVIYSLIFTAVYSFALDKVHSQNITVEAKIITHDTGLIEQEIMNGLQRGVTRWDCIGSYTGQQGRVLCVVLSKYELPQLRYIVHKADPHAFIVINNNVHVDGNFIKRL